MNEIHPFAVLPSLKRFNHIYFLSRNPTQVESYTSPNHNPEARRITILYLNLKTYTRQKKQQFNLTSKILLDNKMGKEIYSLIINWIMSLFSATDRVLEHWNPITWRWGNLHRKALHLATEHEQVQKRIRIQTCLLQYSSRENLKPGSSITFAEETLHFQPKQQNQSLSFQEIDWQELSTFHLPQKLLYFH